MPGFRTGIVQSKFPISCKGAKARLDVPRSSDMNAINDNVYPEFFLNVNTVKGDGNFDGGIINKGDHWVAFIYGGKEGRQTWQKKIIPDKSGERMRLKLKGEVYNGKHSLCLYVYDEGHSEGSPVVIINEDTPATYNNNIPMGDVAEAASRYGCWRLHYELNLVPKIDKKYITLTNNRGRAYFKSAEFAYCCPIDENDQSIKRYHSGKNINCDKFVVKDSNGDIVKDPDGQPKTEIVYSDDVVKQVTEEITIGDSWIKTSIDFRKYNGPEENNNNSSTELDEGRSKEFYLF